MAFEFRARLVKNGALDGAAAAMYTDQLCELFYASPEGTAFLARGLSPGWTEFLVHYGLELFQASPATLRATQLAALVFEHFPKKVSCDPDAAVSILEELRAFYRYARRAHALAAAPCLDVLGATDAVRRLQQNLADPNRWGMAKSFVMQGEQAGFDMTTSEGLRAWTDAYNAGLTSPPKNEREARKPSR